MPITEYSSSHSIHPGSEYWASWHNINTPNGTPMEFRWLFKGLDFRTETRDLDQTLSSTWVVQHSDYDWTGSGPGHHRAWLFYYSAINGGGGNDTITGLDTGIETAIREEFAREGGLADIEGVDLYATASDLLLGGAGNDKIYGRGGNDQLGGEAGNDLINGGAGTDTARFSGNFSDYKISLSTRAVSSSGETINTGTIVGGPVLPKPPGTDGVTFTIEDLRAGSPDGTDTITDVELFQFADGTRSLTELLPKTEVLVRGKGFEIVDGDATPSKDDGTDFGMAAVGGTSVDRVFTVHNTGNTTLYTSGLKLPEGFVAVNALPSKIEPGASGYLTVRLDTSIAGTKQGEITFTANDADEGTYSFAIKGTVAAPARVSIHENDASAVMLSQGAEGTASFTVRFEGHLSDDEWKANNDRVVVELRPDAFTKDARVFDGVAANATDSQYGTDWGIPQGTKVEFTRAELADGFHEKTVDVKVFGGEHIDAPTKHFTLGVWSSNAGVNIVPDAAAVGTIHQAGTHLPTTRNAEVKFIDPTNAVSQIYEDLIKADVEAALDRVLSALGNEKLKLDIEVDFNATGNTLAEASYVPVKVSAAEYHAWSPSADPKTGDINVPSALVAWWKGNTDATDIKISIDRADLHKFYGGQVDTDFFQTFESERGGIDYSLLKRESIDMTSVLTHELLHGFGFGDDPSHENYNDFAWSLHVDETKPGEFYYWVGKESHADSRLVRLNEAAGDSKAGEHMYDSQDLMYYAYNGERAISEDVKDVLKDFGYALNTNSANAVNLPSTGGTFVAKGSNDLVSYTGGFVKLDGGDGIDTLDLSTFRSAAWVNLGYNGAEGWTRDGGNLVSGSWREIADLANVENLVGTAFDDALTGDANANSIYYTAGLDKMDGAGGIDTANFSRFGSAVWIDLLYQGREAWTKDSGNLVSGTWREIADLANVENLVGTAFDDQLTGDASANRIDGGAGNDVLRGQGGDDIIDGGAGNDTAVFANATSSYRFQLSGSSILVTGAGEGTDTVRESVEYFRFGNQTLTRAQMLTGLAQPAVSENADSVAAPILGGNLNTLGGDDTVRYTDGYLTLDGGAGIDTLDLSAFRSAAWVNLDYNGADAWTRDGANLAAGTWREIADLANVENLVGTAFDDELTGNASANTIYYTAGLDKIDGAGGIDTADFSRSGSAVWVDLQYAGREAWTKGTADLASGAWREIADLANIENLTGSAHSDLLSGNSAANRLDGGAGNDVLSGQAGDDVLLGGSGNDKLTGGAGQDMLTGGLGADSFVYNFAGEGLDTIADFRSIEGDRIVVSATGFGGGLKGGTSVHLVSVAGKDVASSANGSGYFIFDNEGADAGTLYWDATGNGGADATALMKLDGVSSLTAMDLLVV